MKTSPIQNVCLIALLLAACGLVSALAEDQSPTPSVSPSATASVYPSPSALASPPGVPACNNASWNPEMFELQKDGTFTVTEWEGKDTSRLACDIDKAIMANKGVNCVGEQMKAVIVKALNKGKVSNSVAAPETPAAAFGHSIKAAKGDFIKSEVIVAC